MSTWLRVFRPACIVALALSAAPAALEAKSATVKLTLTGPGLAAPIQIVDPAILAGSNVWDGSFIGETLAAAPRVTREVYSVRFDVELPAWQRAGVQTMYTVSLAREAKSGELVLYLPGHGETGHQRNVRTILRETHDGRWHRPSRAWAAAIGPYVP